MRHAPRQRGFTYLAVLFIIAFMGVAMAVAGTQWHTAVMRDREVQLLYAGNQYRQAIERYYVNGLQQYPRTLDDLLKDPRRPDVQRYLRKLYPDPVTNSADWGIVKAPDGGVMGVYSQSQDAPLKTAGFKFVYRTFEGSAHYSDWKFVYDPTAQNQPLPATQPAPPGGASPFQSMLLPAQSPAPAAAQPNPAPGSP